MAQRSYGAVALTRWVVSHRAVGGRPGRQGERKQRGWTIVVSMSGNSR